MVLKSPPSPTSPPAPNLHAYDASPAGCSRPMPPAPLCAILLYAFSALMPSTAGPSSPCAVHHPPPGDRALLPTCYTRSGAGFFTASLGGAVAAVALQRCQVRQEVTPEAKFLGDGGGDTAGHLSISVGAPAAANMRSGVAPDARVASGGATESAYTSTGVLPDGLYSPILACYHMPPTRATRTHVDGAAVRSPSTYRACPRC
jgi:hypothetical protein